jgi:glycosyltransferase involved in cell wall biosynthesis
VDTKKFKPVLRDEKMRLRQKYGIQPDAFLLLHVGHFRENRGLRVFAKILSGKNVRCLVVGGTSLEASEQLKRDLETAGCRILHDYIANIEEVYQLADCFVFPAPALSAYELPQEYQQLGAIDTPLTVLEAMACNIPVITTAFGALPRTFPESPGVYYYDGSVEQLQEMILEVQQLRECQTRAKLTGLDWSDILRRAEDLYAKLLTAQ